MCLDSLRWNSNCQMYRPGEIAYSLPSVPHTRKVGASLWPTAPCHSQQVYLSVVSSALGGKAKRRQIASRTSPMLGRFMSAGYAGLRNDQSKNLGSIRESVTRLGVRCYDQ